MSAPAQRWLLAVLFAGCAATGCAATPKRAASVPVGAASRACTQLTAADAMMAHAPDGGAGAQLASHALAAGVADGAAPGLLLYDLSARALRWRAPVTPSARPQLLQDVVVTTLAGQVAAFDLRDGSQRWALPLQRAQWLGASQTGAVVVYTTTTPALDPRQRASSVSAVDASTGAQRWQREFHEAISRPTCSAEHCWVIAEGHELLTFDARSGADLGCASVSGVQLEWLAAADGGGLLFGTTPARAKDALGSSRAAARVPDTELPGQTQLRPSGYDAIPAGRSAHGRIALLAPLAPDAGGAALLGDRYYSVFYRDLFAHRADGAFAWAALLDHDVVAGHASSAGLVLVTGDGKLVALDAQTGARSDLGSFGAAISSADLDVIGPLPPTAAAPAAIEPLRNALSAIALDPDTRLLPARQLAIDALISLADPAATADLLAIYGHDGMPAPLRAHLASQLPKRSVGTEYLVDALLAHYDFLDDTRSPPLHAIIPALIAQRQTRAVPRLVDHLFDPATPEAELEPLVDALDELGGTEVVSPLSELLRLYHADSALAATPQVLTRAARALLRRGDPEQTAFVERLAQDARTSQPLREQLAALLPSAQSSSATTAAVPAWDTPPAAPRAEPSVARTLTTAAVDHVMREHAQELRECVLAELQRTPKLTAVRIAFVANNDGSASSVRVTPDTPALRACLGTKVSSYNFGRFRARRTLASYVVSLHAGAPDATASAGPSVLSRDFWSLSQQRAQANAAPWVPLHPWWQNQNPLFVSVEPGKPTAASTPTATQAQTAVRAADHAAAAAPAPQPTAGTAGTAAPAAPQAPQAPAPEDSWWLPAQQ